MTEIEKLKNEVKCLKQQRILLDAIIKTQEKQLKDIQNIIYKGGMTQEQIDKLIAEMKDD